MRQPQSPYVYMAALAVVAMAVAHALDEEVDVKDVCSFYAVGKLLLSVIEYTQPSRSALACHSARLTLPHSLRLDGRTYMTPGKQLRQPMGKAVVYRLCWNTSGLWPEVSAKTNTQHDTAAVHLPPAAAPPPR